VLGAPDLCVRSGYAWQRRLRPSCERVSESNEMRWNGWLREAILHAIQRPRGALTAKCEY
ncbi:MAG: hypothetical protein ACK52S_22855, partial [Pirellula sp.]